MGLFIGIFSAVDLNHRLFEVEEASFFFAIIFLDRMHVDSKGLLDGRGTGIHAQRQITFIPLQFWRRDHALVV